MEKIHLISSLEMEVLRCTCLNFYQNEKSVHIFMMKNPGSSIIKSKCEKSKIIINSFGLILKLCIKKYYLLLNVSYNINWNTIFPKKYVWFDKIVFQKR